MFPKLRKDVLYASANVEKWAKRIPDHCEVGLESAAKARMFHVRTDRLCRGDFYNRISYSVRVIL